MELVDRGFQPQATSADFTGGFNHGLRAIPWRAFGAVNFGHFRLRVLDRFGSKCKS